MMKGNVRICAQHGWAFQSSSWDIWRNDLPDGWQMSALDRGYFRIRSMDDRDYFQSSTDEAKVLVVHSFGLHIVPSEIIAKADLLVIVSGFEQFHDGGSPTTRRVIKRMLTRMCSDHVGLLHDFYSACDNRSHPLLQIDENTNCNLKMLSADLVLLDTNCISISNLSRSRSILILHGQKDTIVPVHHAYNLLEKLPGSRLAIHPEAGHTLPFSHPQWCIQNLVESLSVEKHITSTQVTRC